LNIYDSYSPVDIWYVKSASSTTSSPTTSTRRQDVDGDQARGEGCTPGGEEEADRGHEAGRQEARRLGHEAEKIVDPGAKKPDDWDEEEDGTWKAPGREPEVQASGAPRANLRTCRMGSWSSTRKLLTTVGIDISEVKSGSVFDNVVTDNLDEVNAIDKT
jgi:hypothetical protein